MSWDGAALAPAGFRTKHRVGTQVGGTLPWHSSEMDPVQLHFDYCTMAWLLSMNYGVSLPSCFCIVYRTLNMNVVLLCDPGSIPFN